MPDVTPFFTPSDPFTCHAATAVTGGRIVSVTGNLAGDAAGAIEGGGGYPSVGHAGGATARPLGVAARDRAAGQKVSVFTTGWKVPVELGGVVTAGDLLESGADGRALTLATAGAQAAGRALASGVAGDFVMVQVS